MAGEPPVETAKRELHEEADLTASTWHVLADYYPSGGGTSEAVRVFLARDLAQVPASERHERMDEEATWWVRGCLWTRRWTPLPRGVSTHRPW